MVDSEHCTKIYKSLKISVGAVMKNPETLNSFLITKKICKHAVKNYLL